MSALRRYRRLFAFPALVASVLVMMAGTARAEMGSFYGRENIQFIETRYAPLLLSESGGNYELLFGFVTSADQIETPGSSRLFNGVTVGGGGFNWTDAEIDGYERNAAGAYVSMAYQGFLFANNSADSRPYLNWTLGYARGPFWGDPVGEVDPVIDYMNIYSAGLRGGIQVRLKDKYFLDLGMGIEARGISMQDEYRAYYPVMVTVGVSHWIGALKADRFPDL